MRRLPGLESYFDDPMFDVLNNEAVREQSDEQRDQSKDIPRASWNDND